MNYGRLEGATKQDGGKLRLDLVPPEAMTAMGRVLTFGAAKYAARNWEHGMSWGRIVAALLRHLFAWVGGEDKDPESGFSHLDHVICNAAFLVTYEARGVGEDDLARRASVTGGEAGAGTEPSRGEGAAQLERIGGYASTVAPCAACHLQFGEHCLRACPFGKKAKTNAD